MIRLLRHYQSMDLLHNVSPLITVCFPSILTCWALLGFKRFTFHMSVDCFVYDIQLQLVICESDTKFCVNKTRNFGCCRHPVSIYSNLCVYPDESYAYTSLLQQFTLLRITHIYPFIRIAIRIYIVATLYIRYSLYINLYYPIMLILI